MMARSEPAATITHFAQDSGHQKTATTTMPKASRKRQKHNFMIILSFRHEFSLSYGKNIYDSSIKLVKKSNLCMGDFGFQTRKGRKRGLAPFSTFSFCIHPFEREDDFDADGKKPETHKRSHINKPLRSRIIRKSVDIKSQA